MFPALWFWMTFEMRGTCEMASKGIHQSLTRRENEAEWRNIKSINYCFNSVRFQHSEAKLHFNNSQLRARVYLAVRDWIRMEVLKNSCNLYVWRYILCFLNFDFHKKCDFCSNRLGARRFRSWILICCAWWTIFLHFRRNLIISRVAWSEMGSDQLNNKILWRDAFPSCISNERL